MNRERTVLDEWYVSKKGQTHFMPATTVVSCNSNCSRFGNATNGSVMRRNQNKCGIIGDMVRSEPDSCHATSLENSPWQLASEP